MKEYEDIFGTNSIDDNSENNSVDAYETVVPVEEIENEEVPVEENELGENIVNEEVSVIPNYSEIYETVAPEEVETEEEPVEENVFGENVVNEEIPLMPDYSEIYEAVAPEEVETEEEPVEENVLGENVVNEETPVIPNYSETYETVVPEEINDNLESNQTHDSIKENNYNPMEHPDAKIVLNKNVEEEKEVDPELAEMKISEVLKENKSLKFIAILGFILLVVIIAIPYVSELLG